MLPGNLSHEEVLGLQVAAKKQAIWTICDDIGMLLFFLSTLCKNDKEAFQETQQLLNVLDSLIQKAQNLKDAFSAAHTETLSYIKTQAEQN